LGLVLRRSEGGGGGEYKSWTLHFGQECGKNVEKLGKTWG